MNRTLGLTLGLAALLLTVAAVPAGTRTTAKVDKVNLADLKDGESRTFGKNDHAITATRNGDEITIRFAGKDGEAKTLKCTVGKDSCYAMTMGDDGKNRVIIMNKGGEGSADHLMLHEGDGGGEPMMVFSGGPGETEDVVIHSAHGNWVEASGVDGDSAAVKVIRVHGEGGTMLECPEGDATLRLKKGEENSGPYFCPKHNLKMEKAKEQVIMKKIEVVTTGDEE